MCLFMYLIIMFGGRRLGDLYYNIEFTQGNFKYIFLDYRLHYHKTENNRHTHIL